MERDNVMALTTKRRARRLPVVAGLAAVGLVLAGCSGDDATGTSVDAPPSPLVLTMFDGGIREDMEQSFCSWECAAAWFAARAGGQFRQDPTPAENEDADGRA